ncbi:methionine ABC transporter substrate-binding protein [Klebsiella pneumoniae]|uniref:Methionine ABC transporter substrate-binding protein n=1 Tax=Klebsiella pneumoniae TaxID=573 RepID=A0A447RHC9_KLEPN|nr:methionine ABC transporter substrate-binding protein [Klebsiella pneumoniae]
MDVCPGCRAARRRGPGSPRGDPQLHQKIDPSLDLKVVEADQRGVNANELLASGDVDANYFQHVPYLKDQEKAVG